MVLHKFWFAGERLQAIMDRDEVKQRPRHEGMQCGSEPMFSRLFRANLRVPFSLPLGEGGPLAVDEVPSLFHPTQR